METTVKTPNKPRVNPDDIKTEWSGWVNYGPPDNPNRSGASIYGRTLSELVADGVQTATYYLAMGYVARVGGIQRSCCRCHGSGILMARRLRTKRCPDCKGIGVFQTGGDPVPVKAPNGVILKAPGMEPTPTANPPGWDSID